MEPTELEHLILAMVADGVSSGYAMKKVMEGMRGGRWSSESGSVYRITRRLLERGLLEESGRGGSPNRERTEYRVTAEGGRVLDDWLRHPPSREELGYQVDSLRTRSYFLDRLPVAERLVVVRRWQREAKAYRIELGLYMESVHGASPLKKIAMSNLIDMAEARMAWLKRLDAFIRASAPSD